ncbi:mitochondrial small ribosomal subunit Rsm22-domain-containing protein [Tirmania nivea]|nr:mitochondrial small ribosomal subunit Rsm22-domain-containing protein [Tirmania nivea]
MFLRTRAIVRASKVPIQLRPSAAPRPAIARVTNLQFLRQFSAACSIRQESRTECEIEKYVRAVKKEHGENLPQGLLSEEEYTIYERYFGTPARLLREGEEAYIEEEDAEINICNAAGEVIETVSRLGLGQSEAEEVEKEKQDVDAAFTEELNEADAKAYAQISKDIERAYRELAREVKKAQEGGEQEDPEYPPEEEDPEEDGEGGETQDLPDDAIRGESSYLRIHPLSRMGRFATFPFTVEPPEALTGATEKFLSDVPNKHLDQAAHRAFTDIQLSSSPINTEKKKNKSATFPIHPDDPDMTDMQANVHFATVMPGLHAQALSALTELRRRLGRDWAVNEVNRILDIGSGGAGVLAWQGIVDAEESANGPTYRTNPETQEPEEEESLKATVIIASPALRYRSAQMLDNTTFLPRLPDAHPTNTIPGPAESNQIQQPRKFYDLIIASNTLLPIREDYKRKYHVENLWSLLNPTGGVLLLIEKGNFLGFEAIAGARSHLLKYNITSPGSEFRPHRPHEDLEQPPKPKEVGQIVAPCTNHEECPMFIGGPGLPGRKDFCRFQQRYTRPSYMQRIMRSTSRNHEDAEYSFVAVRRGKDARLPEGHTQINPTLEDFDTTKDPVASPYTEEALRSYYHTLPRIILDPLKKPGHVTIDLCTSEGKMERWTVPKSYGKTAFRDAKKSGWGDLWALGAKTKVPRNLKIGKIGKYDKAKEKRQGKIAWLKQKREEKEAKKKARVLHKKESKAQNWAKQKGIKALKEGD